jgi:hypothetical protein
VLTELFSAAAAAAASVIAVAMFSLQVRARRAVPHYARQRGRDRRPVVFQPAIYDISTRKCSGQL